MSSPLELRDVGASGEAADVMLSCRSCQKRKPLAPAFSEEGKVNLPRCRGWHPHLRVAPLEECQSLAVPITLGATNVWFARTLSALSIPSSSDPLEQLVEQDLLSLFEDVESERDTKLARKTAQVRSIHRCANLGRYSKSARTADYRHSDTKGVEGSRVELILNS